MYIILYMYNINLLMRLTYNQIESFLKPIFLLWKIYKHSIQNDNITSIKKKTNVKRPLAKYA